MTQEQVDRLYRLAGVLAVVAFHRRNFPANEDVEGTLDYISTTVWDTLMAEGWTSLDIDMATQIRDDDLESQRSEAWGLDWRTLYVPREASVDALYASERRAMGLA
jgi:hypothetical protein